MIGYGVRGRAEADKNAYDAVSSGARGDADALLAQASGIAAGIVVESACQSVAGFAGGTDRRCRSSGVEAGCGYASTAVGDCTSNAVENKLKS